MYSICIPTCCLTLHALPLTPFLQGASKEIEGKGFASKDGGEDEDKVKGSDGKVDLELEDVLGAKMETSGGGGGGGKLTEHVSLHVLFALCFCSSVVPHFFIIC